MESLSRFVFHGCQTYGLDISRQERIALANSLRRGDISARERIILASLNYCSMIASRYYKVFPQVEYVDFFQIGVLAIMQSLDRSLAKYDDPFPYLFFAARYEMLDHGHLRSYLICIPETREKDGHIRDQPYEMFQLEGELEKYDLSRQRTKQEPSYAALYKAIERLEGKYKTVIEMRFGLNGYPPTSLTETNLALSSRKNGRASISSSAYQRRALHRLRKYLEEEGIQR